MILIVGAGPTGLTAALELSKRGHTVRIIDKKKGPSNESKALAIQARTLEILDQMGIVDDFLEEGDQKQGVLFHLNKHEASVQLPKLDTPYPFVLSIPQSRSERILIDHLKIEVEWETELIHIDNERCLLRDKKGKEEWVKPAWLIGCDGGKSLVRQAKQIPFEGSELPATFALADMKAKTSLDSNFFHVFFHKRNVAVLFPFPDNTYRMVFLTKTKEERDLENYTAGFIEDAFDKRYPYSDFVPRKPSWVSIFSIHDRAAKHLRKGNTFLAGDAAHIHSPIGGQGMNTSIQDAYNLSWKLDLVIRGIATDSLLDSYEQERLPIIHNLLKQTTRATRLVMLARPLLVFNLLKMLYKKIAHGISQLGVNYCHSPIVSQPKRDRKWKGPKPGMRAPYGHTANGTSLFSYFRAQKHVIFLFQENEEFVQTIKKNYGKWVDIYVIFGDEVKNKYAAKPESLYLIRPDGYVGYRSLHYQPAELLDYLNTISQQ